MYTEITSSHGTTNKFISFDTGSQTRFKVLLPEMGEVLLDARRFAIRGCGVRRFPLPGDGRFLSRRICDRWGRYSRPGCYCHPRTASDDLYTLTCTSAKNIVMYTDVPVTLHRTDVFVTLHRTTTNKNADCFAFMISGAVVLSYRACVPWHACVRGTSAPSLTRSINRRYRFIADAVRCTPRTF